MTIEAFNVMQQIIKFKIKGLPKNKEYVALPFGRRLEFDFAIGTFKAKARKVHLSQKRQTYSKAIREAIDLYNVDQYFCKFSCNDNVKDDSFEFFYTTKG